MKKVKKLVGHKCPNCGFVSEADNSKAGVNTHRSASVSDGNHRDPIYSNREPEPVYGEIEVEEDNRSLEERFLISEDEAKLLENLGGPQHA